MLLVVILGGLIQKSSYNEVLKDNLDDSILYSVRMLQVDRTGIDYEGIGIQGKDINWGSDSFTGDNAEFKQKFVAYLAKRLNTKITDLDVELYAADSDKGVLSVEVTAHFRYPTGQEDTVSTYKTVILNRFSK